MAGIVAETLNVTEEVAATALGNGHPDTTAANRPTPTTRSVLHRGGAAGASAFSGGMRPEYRRRGTGKAIGQGWIVMAYPRECVSRSSNARHGQIGRDGSSVCQRVVTGTA